MDIGGQAVIEGVMMRSKNYYSIAVRKPDGKTTLTSSPFKSITAKYPVLGLPFIRGVVSLVEMVVLGMKGITYSGNIASGDDDDEESISTWWFVITIILSLGLAVFLFKYLPLLAAQLINNRFLSSDSSLLFSSIDGTAKIMIFVMYIAAISMWGEMRTVFQYHGAEHKSVHCYEAKKKLSVRNVKTFSTLHKRCGTSFIIIVLLLSIFVYAFIPNSVGFLYKLLYRLLLLPVIAGVSYEILKLGAKYPDNIFLDIVTAPGLWFQKMTTREPDDKQIRVAITALKKVLSLEKA